MIDVLVAPAPITISVDLKRAFSRSDDTPKDWSQEDIARAISRYEKFLKLAAKHRGRRHAPTRDIDVIWHLHMLHPRAYFEDCNRLFGEIFDHDGGFGKSESELPKLISIFESTAELWAQEYGEPYVKHGSSADQMEKCWHDCQGRCWHACADN